MPLFTAIMPVQRTCGYVRTTPACEEFEKFEESDIE